MLGRVAGQMLTVGLVLFVLSRYHSPQLAGAATFLLLFPGLLLSPIAGVLLDRYGRTRLITVDYIVVAIALFSMAGLSAGHRLPPSLLLGICAVASLTGPLSAAGVRSLFPSVVAGSVALLPGLHDRARRQAHMLPNYSIGWLPELLKYAGWHAESLPGRPVVMRNGDATVEPFVEVNRLSRGEVDTPAWQQSCSDLGIRDVPLVPA